MKTALFSLFLLLSLTFACKKESENDATPTVDVFVKADVDGKPFIVGAVPDPGSSTGSYAIFSKSENKLFIYGTGTTVILAVTVQDFPKKTGTFPLGGTNAGSIGSYTDASDPQLGATYTMQGSRTGSVTISSFDGKVMSGTFFYTVYNSQKQKEVKITNGEFKVPYTEI
jgi:hypothetical protein